MIAVLPVVAGNELVGWVVVQAEAYEGPLGFLPSAASLADLAGRWCSWPELHAGNIAALTSRRGGRPARRTQDRPET
ncbi:MAG: hypothetical protein P8R42_24205 [Candidatus Binatia bacterium]|nr:hypothetical protein [Candidatus Binatia bacterium]